MFHNIIELLLFADPRYGQPVPLRMQPVRVADPNVQSKLVQRQLHVVVVAGLITALPVDRR